MDKSITNRQIVFIFVLIVSSFRTTEIPQLVAKTTGRSGWILILLFALPYALVAMMIAKLNVMYPGLTVFEYGQKILGKVIMYIMSVLFVLYFFAISVYLNQSFNTLITQNFLPQTKPSFSLAVSAALYGYVVYKGTNATAKLFELLGLMYVIVTLGLCAIMFTQIEPYNILPLYNPDEGKQLFSSAFLFLSVYGGVENLFLVPLSTQNKKAPKVAFITILAIGLLFVLITEATIGMLGINNTIVYNDAFVEAVKLAEAPVIQRLDIFYLTFGLASLFAGLIILLHSVIEFLVRMMPMAKRSLVVSSVTFAFYCTTLVVIRIHNFNEMFNMVLQVLALLFAVVFPTVLFLLAIIKNRSASKPKRRNI